MGYKTIQFVNDVLDGDPNKARLFELLLKGESVTQAAEIVGVHRVTAQRWSTDPDFAAAMVAAVADRHAAVVRRLRAVAPGMVDVLVEIASDQGAPASARVSAAREVLDRAGVPRLERLEIAATMESLSWSETDAAELSRLAASDAGVIDVECD